MAVKHTRTHSKKIPTCLLTATLLDQPNLSYITVALAGSKQTAAAAAAAQQAARAWSDGSFFTRFLFKFFRCSVSRVFPVRPEPVPSAAGARAFDCRRKCAE